jgi:hypothetical protein
MWRTFLSLIILAVQLIVAERAFCRPPDEVVNSPVPPIKAPAQNVRESNTPTPSGLALGINPRGINVGPQQRVATSQDSDPRIQPGLQQDGAANRGAVSEQSGAAAKPEVGETRYYSTSASDLWNSQPMREAREGVLEFSRRSAQSTQAEGEQFLSRLSQSSLKEMKSWLDRYQARQQDLSFRREVGQLARKIMLEEAIDQQQATRRAYERVSRIRDAAAAAQEQNAIEQAQATQFHRDRRREQQLRIIGLGPIYNPLEPVLDPMSPRGYRRRVAAAMSLPGDLPPGDPRNFIRGEEGIDTGEWTNNGGAEPPVSGVSETPAGPAPAAPAPAAPVGPAPAGE